MSSFKKDSLKSIKPMMGLIDPIFKEELAKLLTLGGYKYDFNNWKLADRSQSLEYRHALERHLTARDKGEVIDQDTGLPHTIAIAFNAMAMHFFDLKFNADDGDRSLYEERINHFKELK